MVGSGVILLRLNRALVYTPSGDIARPDSRVWSANSGSYFLVDHGVSGLERRSTTKEGPDFLQAVCFEITAMRPVLSLMNAAELMV